MGLDGFDPLAQKRETRTDCSYGVIEVSVEASQYCLKYELHTDFASHCSARLTLTCIFQDVIRIIRLGDVGRISEIVYPLGFLFDFRFIIIKFVFYRFEDSVKEFDWWLQSANILVTPTMESSPRPTKSSGAIIPTSFFKK